MDELISKMLLTEKLPVMDLILGVCEIQDVTISATRKP